MQDNLLIRQISEVYSRIHMYCIISNIKEEMKNCKDEKELKQLQEALDYANKRAENMV
jgi:Xaa-Pro aminopeptidase